MNKIIYTFIIISLILISHLDAQTFEVNGINYNILNTNEVEVTSDDNCYTGDLSIPSTVDYNATTYNVTTIGFEAFRGCLNITSISLQNSITTIREAAFRDCRNITSLIIPDSVTLIERSAFLYCTDLISISLPNQITILNPFLFGNCINLVSIDIPDMVETISSYAFTNCVSLTTVNVPNTVTSIDGRAFDDCTGLTSFSIDIEVPISIIPSVFANIALSNANLYVPVGSESAYSSAPIWQDFGNINPPLNSDIYQVRNLKMHPNPTTDFVSISNLNTAENYIIYDVLGKKADSGQLLPESQISVGHLEKGIYFLKLDRYKTLRFIKH